MKNLILTILFKVKIINTILKTYVYSQYIFKITFHLELTMKLNKFKNNQDFTFFIQPVNYNLLSLLIIHLF